MNERSVQTLPSEATDCWLSAIIPNYNEAALLPHAISALRAQDPPPDEIIVVDDGSTDASAEVVARLSTEMPTLTLIRSKYNRGVIPALNRGIEAVRGRYIYFGSANDTVAPGFFSTARQMLADHPDCGFFCSECRIVTPDGCEIAMRPPARPSSRPRHFPPANVPGALSRLGNFAPSSSVVMLKSAVVAAGGLQPDLGSFADGYLLRYLALRHGFCFAPIVGANWTYDRSSVSVVTASDSEINLRILNATLAKMRTDPYFPPDYPSVFERQWRFGVGRINADLDEQHLLGISPIVAPAPYESLAWRGLAKIPGLMGRFLRLVWLTIRFRPFSLSAIVTTQVLRMLERR